MDFERGVCHGRLRYIDDLVTYEADNPKQLVAEFEAAVEDYLATCAQLGREPKKSASGVFNVRTTPEKHAMLIAVASISGRALNAVVNDAFDCFLDRPRAPESFRGYELDLAHQGVFVISGSATASQFFIEAKGVPSASAQAKPQFAPTSATSPAIELTVRNSVTTH